MNDPKSILITGGAGFIGSVLAGYLCREGYTNLIIVDRFNNPAKLRNLEGKSVSQKIESTELFQCLQDGSIKPDFIFHLGARIDTLKADYSEFENQNVSFAQRLWQYATQSQVPFVYASSAATYGNEDENVDNENLLNTLHPLGGYGKAKHEFDRWVVGQNSKPPLWAGLKFFNVYGPNEYHKEGRYSMVYRCYHEALNGGSVRLFGSNKPTIPDGGHLRDFIYVLDVAKVCAWFLRQWKENKAAHLSGIYNVGTAIPRSYNDLAYSVFKSLGSEVKITYEEIPEGIRDGYKDVISGSIDKLRNAGYKEPMYTLEEGVEEYIQQYLRNGLCY